MSTTPHTEKLHFVGYFPKNTKASSGWSASGHVKEICSVSDCVNSSPPGWIDHWLHNELGFFNTEMDAKLVIPPECAVARCSRADCSPFVSSTAGQSD